MECWGHSAPMTDWNTCSGTETKNGEDSGHGEFGLTGFTHSKSARSKTVYFQDLAYTVMNLHVLRSVQPAPLEEEEDGIVLVNPYLHWLQAMFLGMSIWGSGV